jgi:glycine cleavage system H protein
MANTVTNRLWIKKGLVAIAAGGVILLTIPLLAVLGLAFQFVFLVAAPVILLAVILIPQIGRREEVRAEGAASVRGVTLVPNAYYNSNHCWARVKAGARIVLGADDFMQKIIGPVSDVVMPEVGRPLKRGEPMVTLKHGRREIEVRAPVAGVVNGVNNALSGEPGLINRAPYANGWLVELAPDRFEDPPEGFQNAAQAEEWMRSEVDRLVALASGTGRNLASVADGGEVPENCCDELDDKTWNVLAAAFFD